MRILLAILILLSTSSIAQPADPAVIYGMHTRLGMNGNLKTSTTYKYTKLKPNTKHQDSTTGILYSVIKNWYDSLGRITQDSTAIYYNKKTAMGYCKTYEYTTENNKQVIHVTTHWGCVPPYDNPSIEQSIIILSNPTDSTVLAREYSGDSIRNHDKKIITAYRFLLNKGLLQATIFDSYKKGKEYGSGTTTYKYDKYNNFVETTLKVGGNTEVIRHDISHIDEKGNALRMLNYYNEEEAPEFMTTYEFEYYE